MSYLQQWRTITRDFDHTLSASVCSESCPQLAIAGKRVERADRSPNNAPMFKSSPESHMPKVRALTDTARGAIRGAAASCAIPASAAARFAVLPPLVTRGTILGAVAGGADRIVGTRGPEPGIGVREQA